MLLKKITWTIKRGTSRWYCQFCFPLHCGAGFMSAGGCHSFSRKKLTKFAPLSVKETQETPCLPKTRHFQSGTDVPVTTEDFHCLGRTLHRISFFTTKLFCFPCSDAGKTDEGAEPYCVIEDQDNSRNGAV